MSEHADPPASNTAGELPPATAHSSPVISSLPPCTRPLLPCLPSIRTPYNPDIYNTYYHAPLPASSIPTITKLNGRNYRTWAINMELVLRCKSTVFYRTPAPIIVYYFPYITCLLYLLFLIKHVRTSG